MIHRRGRKQIHFNDTDLLVWILLVGPSQRLGKLSQLVYPCKRCGIENALGVLAVYDADHDYITEREFLFALIVKYADRLIR